MKFRKAPPFDFNWEDFFYGKSAGCYPACIAMALFYWKRMKPDLYLPLNRKEWERKIDNINTKLRGSTIRQNILDIKEMIKLDEIYEGTLEQHLTKDDSEIDRDVIPLQKHSLVFKYIEIDKIEDCNYLFLKNPAIPVLVRYDKIFLEHNVEGIAHASLVYQIDKNEKKIYLIDPTYEKRRKPMIHDLEEFEECWRKTGSRATIAIYPEIIEIDKLLDHGQTSFETFLKKLNKGDTRDE